MFHKVLLCSGTTLASLEYASWDSPVTATADGRRKWLSGPVGRIILREFRVDEKIDRFLQKSALNRCEISRRCSTHSSKTQRHSAKSTLKRNSPHAATDMNQLIHARQG